jgi:hypothetical protein
VDQCGSRGVRFLGDAGSAAVTIVFPVSAGFGRRLVGGWTGLAERRVHLLSNLIEPHQAWHDLLDNRHS